MGRHKLDHRGDAEQRKRSQFLSRLRRRGDGERGHCRGRRLHPDARTAVGRTLPGTPFQPRTSITMAMWARTKTSRLFSACLAGDCCTFCSVIGLQWRWRHGHRCRHRELFQGPGRWALLSGSRHAFSPERAWESVSVHQPECAHRVTLARLHWLGCGHREL